MRATISSKWIALFFLTVISCQKKVDDPGSLLSYCLDPDNGVSQVTQAGDIRLEMTYRPKDLIIFQELKDKEFTSSQIDSVRSAFSGFEYFLFRLSRNGNEIETGYAGDATKFAEVNDYLSFKIGNDIKLVIEADTLETKNFIHTRTFGSSPSSDVLIAFKASMINNSGIARVIFDDSMFESGLHVFDFDISNIKSIPHLDLKPTL